MDSGNGLLLRFWRVSERSKETGSARLGASDRVKCLGESVVLSSNSIGLSRMDTRLPEMQILTA